MRSPLQHLPVSLTYAVAQSGKVTFC